MRLLLDTHIFLWYITADPQLPVLARDAIRDPANEVYLSVASVWEAVIKYGIGKLPLPEPPTIFLPRQRELHRIQSLVIDEGAMAYLAGLQALHRDPFDRMLIAQSLQHNLTITTVDNEIRAYSSVRLLPTS